ncbi:MAG: DegT/DnrJ/EryC1/StrS family aminotransferase [candidate division KSB1 bacterium]|nr:DegT/DnrJ/EryC1/StrS family aminotransferase [candidate division KSB1 bacterium]MDZ7273700.1 DegT/DnrJ/EryC1/StrS family aminotransferase [candidate division KSB1 bacterium]MDZ7285856.1 DegT/DnrJ/EryC1/StrS family aminotransferase [candidate division KSB1 bacterium]MDZ7298888.1 DegT/DnrJ/EryC1/StrS family aminotransferase [candidate division KSB1 bacterium]MDZ7309081.1 DegT/DnrJ/EryC1/StrS family aminotransferase [candidate division KSB1 bacterium]
MQATHVQAATTAIPFLDLQAQYRSIKEEIAAAIQPVLENCDFVGGAAVETFERNFAAFCQTAHAVGVSNGADALYLALRALEIGPGDEVITVPNTFIATASAITRSGARVRFVDVDPATLEMDANQLERAISHRTRAIMPVHLYGQMPDMDAILTLAAQHEIAVIEDAAQAHGASLRGRVAGSLGIAGCFSFYPGKNLGAYGDGGAVVTNDATLAGRVRRLRDQGRDTKYEHLMIGYNHRLDTLQAAVLNVKLRHLPRWNARRREIAARYRQLLQDCPAVRPLAVAPGQEPVYHLFIVQVERRERVQERLKQQGIATGIHYPIPLHLQPAYAFLGLRRGAFPVAEAAAERVLSLPMYAEMSNAMVEQVATALREAALA